MGAGQQLSKTLPMVMLARVLLKKHRLHCGFREKRSTKTKRHYNREVVSRVAGIDEVSVG